MIPSAEHNPRFTVQQPHLIHSFALAVSFFKKNYCDHLQT